MLLSVQHERQLWVIQTVSSERGVACRQHLTADKLLAEQPTKLVDLVDEHIESPCMALVNPAAMRGVRLMQCAISGLPSSPESRMALILR